MFIAGRRLIRYIKIIVWLLFERLDFILATQQENQAKINGYVSELNDSLTKLTAEIQALKEANANLPSDSQLDFSGLDEVTKGLDGLEPPATAPVDSGDGGAVSEPVDPAPETDAPVEVVTPES